MRGTVAVRAGVRGAVGARVAVAVRAGVRMPIAVRAAVPITVGARVAVAVRAAIAFFCRGTFSFLFFGRFHFFLGGKLQFLFLHFVFFGHTVLLSHGRTGLSAGRDNCPMIPRHGLVCKPCPANASSRYPYYSGRRSSTMLRKAPATLGSKCVPVSSRIISTALSNGNGSL